MEQNLSVVQANYDLCDDRISDMPQLVVDHILSFIPMKDALKTKSLSKHWRDVLSSLPNLEFNESNYGYGDIGSDNENFIDFVDRILFSRGNLNVRKLEICSLKLSAMNHLNEWISYAITRGILSLSIKAGLRCESVKGLLPDHLFTSISLRKLELLLDCHLLKLPRNISFPNLEYLKLEKVIFFEDESTARLFSCCPILKILHIWYCDVSLIKTFVISHPHLRGLSINSLTGISNCEVKISTPALILIQYWGDSLQKCIIHPMPSLSEASFNFENGISCGVAKVLEAVNNCKILGLCGFFFESFSRLNLLAYLPSSWCRLNHLGLEIDHSEHHYLAMAALLKICPSLAVLEIKIYDCPTNEFNMQRNWDITELPLSIGMLNHLEEVHIINYDGTDIEKDVVRMFIEKAKYLKRVEFESGQDNWSVPESWIETYEKLQTFTKASLYSIHVVADKDVIILQ